MKSKPVIPRELAHRDIEHAIDYYLNEGGARIALGYIQALERAFTYIGRHPAAGSSRYALDLDLPGLRSWPLTRFPYLVFFVECDDHIDVWRVLHSQRDIPAWMHEPE